MLEPHIDRLLLQLYQGGQFSSIYHLRMEVCNSTYEVNSCCGFLLVCWSHSATSCSFDRGYKQLNAGDIFQLLRVFQARR